MILVFKRVKRIESRAARVPESPVPRPLILAGRLLEDSTTIRVVYRIKNWTRLFEGRSYTKARQTLNWLELPLRLDSDWYLDVVTEDASASCLGAFLALCIVAATCEPRGTLLREDGMPHTPETLANKTRLSVECIKASLRLSLVEAVPWAGEAPAIPHVNGVAKPVKVEPPADSELEYEQWSQHWQSITEKRTGEHKAHEAWKKLVASLSDRAAFRLCSENYLASGEVQRGAVMNRDKWLRENAKDNWSARWPPAKQQPGSAQSVDEKKLADELRRAR